MNYDLPQTPSKLEDADLHTLPEEVELDPATIEFLEENPDRGVETKVGILKEVSEAATLKSKNLTIRFLVSPIEILGDEKVEGIKLVKNELVKSEDGSIRPRATDDVEELAVDLVFRSIGYRGIRLEDIPFHDSWGIIPNQMGRIINPDNNNTITGFYTSGWIKRGPSGVIGTNKVDSGETVDSMVEDIENGQILTPEIEDLNEIEKLISSKQPNYISYSDWLKIDSLEKEIADSDTNLENVANTLNEKREHLDAINNEKLKGTI